MKGGSEPQAKFKIDINLHILQDYLNLTRRNNHENCVAFITSIKLHFLPDC